MKTRPKHVWVFYCLDECGEPTFYSSLREAKELIATSGCPCCRVEKYVPAAPTKPVDSGGK